MMCCISFLIIINTDIYNVSIKFQLNSDLEENTVLRQKKLKSTALKNFAVEILHILHESDYRFYDDVLQKILC